MTNWWDVCMVSIIITLGGETLLFYDMYASPAHSKGYEVCMLCRNLTDNTTRPCECNERETTTHILSPATIMLISLVVIVGLPMIFISISKAKSRKKEAGLIKKTTK